MTAGIERALRPPARSTAMLRVRGVLVGRLTDGRPDDEPWMIRDMLDAFEPNTVPVLSSHGGLLLGWLETLAPWHELARGMAFTGSVTDLYPDLTERLRRGVSVSAEHYEPRGWSVRGAPGRRRQEHSYFRGRPGESFTLAGVAISDRPATASWMMADP